MGICVTTGSISSRSTCGIWPRGMAARTPGPWWKPWNTSRSEANNQIWVTWLSWPSGSLCKRGPDAGNRPQELGCQVQKALLFYIYFYTYTIGLSFGLHPDYPDCEEVGIVRALKSSPVHQAAEPSHTFICGRCLSLEKEPCKAVHSLKATVFLSLFWGSQVWLAKPPWRI